MKAAGPRRGHPKKTLRAIRKTSYSDCFHWNILKIQVVNYNMLNFAMAV